MSRKRIRRQRQPVVSPETKAAEAVTVAWMLSLLAAVAAEIIGILTRLLLILAGPSDRLRVLSGTLLLVACLAGAAALLLTPVTLKIRQVRPPNPLIVAAVIIGALPTVTVALLALSRL